MSPHKRIRPHIALPNPSFSGVPDVSVVIVNYNVREFLEQALRSVRRASERLDVEVFVVDNNSVDGSVEMVRCDFPDVHVIANDANVGFSRANNQAIRAATGRYLLILNPDTILQEDTLETLVRFMDEHPDAGAAGCKILNPDGSFARESRRAFPRPMVAFYRLIGLSTLFPHSRRFGRYNLTYLPEDEVAEVDALSGSCMMVRQRALYEDAGPAQKAAGVDGSGGDVPHRHRTAGAGLLDENFFMYGEDLDWCYRIQQAGWKIYFTPETQIIHYKGESTKKGELRYVRLFYGAMLRFTEKHFESRYTTLFTGALRLGIFARASLTLLGAGIRRIGAPLLDGLVVYTVVAAAGIVHATLIGSAPSPLFFASVAPAYALGTVAGITLTGGYDRKRRTRIRPAWLGLSFGMLFVAAASFFVKNIAFSRVVVLVSFVIAAVLLAVWRWIARPRNGDGRLMRQALFVGPAAEAQRFQRMLSHPTDPPFSLVGYVSDADAGRATLPRLGSFHHLRDLVRLRHIDDVIFAADGLSNQTIFNLLQQLRHLPVHARILAAGREHLIGKASIDDLSLASLIEAEDALGEPRTRAARRLFEVPVALAGLALYPVAFVWRATAPSSTRARHLARLVRRMPQVLRGRLALVGYREDDTGYRPPLEWAIPSAVVSVLDTIQRHGVTNEEAERAYWFYARNQSASLDWDIIMRTFRRRGK